jgi:hypothetical protein
MANVEKALQAFDAVDEWADYIAFLVKLQKALLSNPDVATTNWIPYDFQVSVTLSQCILPSLPSGVHKKAIELYTTIFNILQPENTSKSITLWLPGILPLMSYASISIKQDLLDLYNTHIVQLQPSVLRSCTKAILLSLLAALDDTTSEFFDQTMDLIESLKSHLKDITHFWQCLLLIIVTSPDKRAGAMEYMTRKYPSFTTPPISEDIDSDIDAIVSNHILPHLSEDARACLGTEPGLLIKAFSTAMRDENLFVQRGFFDILLSKLPLHLPLYTYIINETLMQQLFVSVTSTVLRKDMSLNRRLWNWLLGPDSTIATTASPKATTTTTTTTTSTISSTATPKLSRLQYFQKYSQRHLLGALLGLITIDETALDLIDPEKLVHNFNNVCDIAISMMDKWEIGQSILPHLFIPILNVSKIIHDPYNSHFEQIIKHANNLFDAVETNVIWCNILTLVQDDGIDLVLFILKNYNVEDEEMIITHVPLILLAAFATFNNSAKRVQLLQNLIKLIPSRALLPLDLANKDLLSIDYYKPTTKDEVLTKLNEYYALAPATATASTDVSPPDRSVKPYPTSDLSALYLGFTHAIIMNSYGKDSFIFWKAATIFDSLLQIIPVSEPGIDVVTAWDTTSIHHQILQSDKDASTTETVTGTTTGNDLHTTFGISVLFKYLIRDLTRLKLLKLLKITLQSLWNCLAGSNNRYQVEIIHKFWNLENIVGSAYIEAALCELLLELDFHQRLSQFNILWIHLNNDASDSVNILHAPLYIILGELQNGVYSAQILKWLKSTMASGTLNKIFRILCMDIFNNEYMEDSFIAEDVTMIDFAKISSQLGTIFNLLSLDVEILNNFKLELCVIDNNKQIEFIRNRNWDISTYKSFMIIVLTKIMEIEPSRRLVIDTHILENYLNCVRLSLMLFGILIDGNEPDFNDIFVSLIGNCEENCILHESKEFSTMKSSVNSYYIETIIKMIKLSSKNQHSKQSIFSISTQKQANTSANASGASANSSKSINLLDFITVGIKSCDSAAAFDHWIDLIISTADYYPDLTSQICTGVIDCMCSKIERDYLPLIKNEEGKVNLIADSVCGLIVGMEQILMKCHKHLGYVLSDNFGFGHIGNIAGSGHPGALAANGSGSGSGSGAINGGSGRETGFFGSVIQGVFQVENVDDKNEGAKKKRDLIEAFRRAIFIVYQMWVCMDPANEESASLHLDVDLDLDFDLNYGKTLNFYLGKIKFRCKKILEQCYLMEPLETIEALIECYETRTERNERLQTGFKLFKVLDDCKQKIILGYILDSIISRVNYSLLEENRRSLLMSNLNEDTLSRFLVEYCKSLTDFENLEYVWSNEIQNFLKDATSNTSSYKYIYPNLLEFLAVIGEKLLSTSYGQQRRTSKDIHEAFMKVLTLCITVKVGSNQATLSSVLLQNAKRNEKGTDHTSDRNVGSNSKEKVVFRKELCMSLIRVSPHMKFLINDSDKLNNILAGIINGVSSIISKSGNITFSVFPEYILDLLVALSESGLCKDLKIWRSFVQDLLQDDGFFNPESHNLNSDSRKQWNTIMKNWVLADVSKVNDFITSKLILSGSTNNTGTLLFNWNDEVDILNGNIPIIKRLIYLMLINERDTFMAIIGPLTDKLDEFFVGFRQMTRYCALESWLLLLLRVIVLKFGENHLTDLWTIINKSLYFLFTETYEKIVEDADAGDDVLFTQGTGSASAGASAVAVAGGGGVPLAADTKEKEEADIFNGIFLQGCKLLDVLVILGQEEFQLNEWIFISDSMDGIFSSIPAGSEVGIVEKICKSRMSDVRSGISKETISDSSLNAKKVPMLLGVTKIGDVVELKTFFNKLKINKYENEYELKDVDYDAICVDISSDIFNRN